MSEAASGSAAWLATADNHRVWARLRDSLELSEGFELLFTVVVDQRAGTCLAELLEVRARELGRQFVHLDARDEALLHHLTSLDEADEVLVVLDTVAASRRALAALERSLLELNPRRDRLAEAIPGPLIVIARPDGLRRFADLAPDLFSVHTAVFRLDGGAGLALDEQPQWLLTDHEFVGLLGIDPSFGFADRSRVPRIARDVPQPPERLIGREELLARLAAALVPGGERVIELRGEPGVGRTALLAQALAAVSERWDRVIWLDCRHIGHFEESNELVDAVIEALTPNEVPPFDPEDARERFVELTTLHAVLIIADDVEWQTRAQPGSRSCLVAVGSRPRASVTKQFVVSALGPDELQELGRAEGLPPSIDLNHLGAGLPASVRVLGRWQSGQDEPSSESLARLGRGGAPFSSLDELCRTLAKSGGRACVEAFEALLDLSGWLLEFPRGVSVSDSALVELERLGILISAGECERFSETGMGQWMHLSELQLPTDWRSRLATGSVAEQLYASLGQALYLQHRSGGLAWLSSAGLESEDIERCAASVAPSLRAAVWQAALDLQPTRRQDEHASLRAALLAALRCGQAEPAHAIQDRLGAEGASTPLLDMLTVLRPTEWNPHAQLGRTFAGTYVMGHAERPIEAALRRGLELEPWFEDDPLPDAPPARVALALRSCACTSALLGELLETLDPTRELDRLAAHFVWARLAWLHILGENWPAFERSLAEVERSARAWGSPYALVRLRLLELIALEARGELDRAAAKLLPTLAAVERCYATRSRPTLALLRRAARIYTELDRSEDAERALAELRARRRAD